MEGHEAERIAIRRALAEDAAALLDLKQALDRETNFMMLEPGEREANEDFVAGEIANVQAASNSVILVADAGKELAGYVEARGGDFRRNRHSAMVIAGVRQGYAGRGIGSRLFESLLAWGGAAGVVRLELTVMAHNAAAIRLYEKFGFEREGLRRKSLRVDGEWVDELSMALILPEDFAANTESG